MRFGKQVHHVGLAILFAISLWPARTAEAQSTLHAPWDSLLKAHVRQGLVDYDALERAPAFTRYLASLDTVTVEALDENGRLAFWINAYNAYTVQLILTHHERQSIRNINRSLGLLQLKGPWNERLVRAGGKVYTLDEVFHRVLRKQFREPRMHFAVVPASKGAPPLRSEAYTGARLEEQLEDQTRRLLSDTMWTWYRRGVLGVNQVMVAYERDFASSRQELVQFVAPYVTLRAQEEQKKRLTEGNPPVFVQGRSYDWSLNVQAPARPAGASVTPPAALPRPR
ncbi:DUF547 domain-containing protein [Gemmatimonas phototrophica]|uniref:DUF547 domain-containing protein n=1 Tax=Gemmatimonas phototrophica TaxID=1379270 RepID=UPI0006A75605|nr:DUF547 domain-containing protein [Gemmatimonas phototrophica]